MSEYINLCLDCDCGCARMGHSCGHPGEHRMCAYEGNLIAKNTVKDDRVHVIGGGCDCYMSPDYYAQWNGLCTIPDGRCFYHLEKYEAESEKEE